VTSPQPAEADTSPVQIVEQPACYAQPFN
jgi:hypothetical protein